MGGVLFYLSVSLFLIFILSVYSFFENIFLLKKNFKFILILVYQKILKKLI
jgi:hypothetical protein